MAFEKSKRMVFPRQVLLGHRVLDRLGGLVGELGWSPPALVVVDEVTKRVAGERAVGVLGAAGHAATLQLIRGATQESVAAVKARASESGARYLVGAGGGSVIDVAKLAAFELGLPYVSLPTSAAHDGIASGRASIKETRGNVSREAKPPDAIVADTHLIAQAPYRMLAAGCGDMVANFVAVKDWELAASQQGEEVSELAAALSRTGGELVLKEAATIARGGEEAAWIVIKSLITSGVAMSVAGSSRPASGSEHLFSHMLDRLAPGVALHGEQCGVGAILLMKLHGGDWQSLRDALRTVKAPTTAQELGHKAEDVIRALVDAPSVRPDRFTILHERRLGAAEAERLARDTGVL